MRFLALFLVLILAMTALAREIPLNTIDKYESGCIKKNPTSAGMSKCSSQVYAMWDKELNVVYSKLLRSLKSKENKSILFNAQKEWIQYRDKNLKLETAVGLEAERNSGGGHMYRTITSGNKIQILKNRVLELQAMLDSLEM